MLFAIKSTPGLEAAKAALQKFVERLVGDVKDPHSLGAELNALVIQFSNELGALTERAALEVVDESKLVKVKNPKEIWEVLSNRIGEVRKESSLINYFFQLHETSIVEVVCIGKKGDFKQN